MFGVAISGGDFRKCMQTKPTADGIDMLFARGQMLLAARAAGVQCFDTVFTDLDDMEGFINEVRQNKAMGFDGKSLINPKQIRLVHEVFAPTEKEIKQAESFVRAYKEQSAAGVGVFTVNGKMISPYIYETIQPNAYVETFMTFMDDSIKSIDDLVNVQGSFEVTNSKTYDEIVTFQVTMP